jgi:amino acid adenylation domain-containing protein
MSQLTPPADAEFCLHALFEASVRRNPDAIALVDGPLSLSYAELDARAEAVRRRLRELGIGPGAVVALAARRSANTIAAVLGTLKAGAAYCPLDLAYPLERLRFMLEDSGAAALIAGREDAEKLADPARPTVALGDYTKPSAELPSPEIRDAGPADVAYLLYTSGSTGKPKGVMVEHASAVNYTRAMIEMDMIGPGERALFFASLSFDVSVGEIFPCLASGATLFIRDDAMLAPADFIRDVERKRIERLSLPTAYWHELAATMAPRGETLPSCVRSLIVIGEALRAESLAYWRPAAKRVRFINGYGPTEATVAVSFHDIPADSPASGIVPIGLPGAGAELRVIDPEGRPVPDGSLGELWIGGPGVARGYLNRPDLTAGRFVPDVFSGRPGARMYRSGDRVRRRPDGVFEFLGRFDDQVKIRGFRVELGEVESALASHPTVGTCAAILRQYSSGDHRLIAYVSSAEGASASGPALRAYLIEKLPEHMVPAVVVTLPVLPLTPNGKIDRRALPPPLTETRGSAETRNLTPLEKQIRRIWEEVLELAPIGLADEFFALGGHSLLAVRMMAKIEKIVGVRPSLEMMRAGVTIERLAREMGESRAEDGPIVRFGPEKGADPVFFVHPGLGGFYCQKLSGAMPDRPFYLLGGENMTGLERLPTIEELARRYVETIRGVNPRGPYRLAGYSIGCTVAYEMARQLEAAGERVPNLMLVAAPFDEASWWWVAARRSLASLRTLLGFDHSAMLNLFNLMGKAGELGVGALKPGGPERVRQAVVRAFSRVRTEGSIRALDPKAAETNETLQVLLWAGAAYEPKPYRGPVTLLEVKDKFLQRNASELKRLSPSVVQVHLPGDHDSIVTTHVGALGEEIRRQVVAVS